MITRRIAHAFQRTHRFVGAAMALLVLSWCASGVVMIFQGYPSLSHEARLQRAAPLVLTAAATYPDALAALLRAKFAQGGELRLRMRDGRATWLYRAENGQIETQSCDPDRRVQARAEERARAIAEAFVGARVTDSARIAVADQWTLTGVDAGEFPLWRFALTDDAGSEVYVAERSFAVVQHTTRRARFYAWIGAIPHWIYPALLRRERGPWRTTVLTLAALGLVASLSGLWLGLRVRRIRRGVPIRERYLRVHHALGLLFGTFVCTWLFSGALSLAPFGWTGLGPRAATLFSALQEGPRAYPPLPTPAALANACARFDREIRLHTFAGALYATCTDAQGDTRSIDLSVPGAQAEARIPLARFEALARRIAGSTRVESVALRDEEDAYHYSTHSRKTVLPFVHIALDDAEHTALYLDPRDGTLLGLYTTRTRLERWLYHGLHSFDVPWLYARPWLWYPSVILALCGSGTLAGLGAAMAMRRAFRRRRAARRRRS